MADSACTATAYLTGVKANFETIGLTAKVKLEDCAGSLAPENRTQSIAEWSMAKGKAVGLVSTSRVTHASPAGAYAHVAHRDWESDENMVNVTNANQCEDIAKQLVTRSPGKDIKAGVRNICVPLRGPPFTTRPPFIPCEISLNTYTYIYINPACSVVPLYLARSTKYTFSVT